MTFDWSVSVSDIVMIAGLLYGLVKARDAFRDLTKAVGGEHPPTGLIGDMKLVKAQQRQHHDWLLIMREKLGFKINGSQAH